MQRIKLTFYFFGFVLFMLTSCSTERIIKRENKKFSKLSSGLKYNSYKSLSKITISNSVQAYNLKKADSLQIDEHDLRLLLGFLYTTNKNYRFAVTECNLVLEKSQDSLEIFIAHTILSTLMLENGWNTISIQEEAKAEKFRIKTDTITKLSTKLYVLELILAKKNLDKNDYEEAIKNLNRISVISGIYWPAQFCNILLEAKNNNSIAAQQQYEIFMADTLVPEKVKVISLKVLPNLLSKPELISKFNAFSSDLFPLIVKNISIAKSANAVLQATEEACLMLLINLK